MWTAHQRSGAADSAVRVTPRLLDLLKSGSGLSVLLRRLLGGVLSLGGAGLFIPATASLSWGQRVWADLLEPETPKKTHSPLPLHMTCLAFPALPHPSRTPRVKEAAATGCFQGPTGPVFGRGFQFSGPPPRGGSIPPGPPQKEIARNFAQNVFWQFFLSFGPLQP